MSEDTWLPTKGGLKEILQERDPEVRGVLAMMLFRFAPYEKAKGLIQNFPALEEQLLHRALALLPEINRMLACTGFDAKVVAHLVLMTALEYNIEQHLVVHPDVPAGLAKEAQRHIEAVRAAASFMVAQDRSGRLFDASSALDFSEVTEDDRFLYSTRHLKALTGVTSEAGHLGGASLLFSTAIDLLALTKTAAEMAMPDDRRRSPKKDLADRCIAMAQAAGRPGVSTAPNSDFTTLVSLVFELASGEAHAALGGAIRAAWAAIKSEGGTHFVVLAAKNELTSQRESRELLSNELEQDWLPRRDLQLITATLGAVKLTDWEREPLFAAYVARLRRITSRTAAENQLLQEAEAMLSNLQRPALRV